MAASVLWFGLDTASASVQFDLNLPFNYNSNLAMASPATPAGSAPWLRVFIAGKGDVGYSSLANNEVQIKITANFALSPAPVNFLNYLGFNFAGNAEDLTFQQVGSSGSFLAVLDENINKSSKDANGNYVGTSNIDGSNPYDIKIDFRTGSSGDLASATRFDGQDEVVLKVTTTQSIIYAAEFVKTTGNGTDPAFGDPRPVDPTFFYAAAQINNVQAPRRDSNGNIIPGEFITTNAYIAADSTIFQAPTFDPAVPEPASMAIWGLGLGVLGLVRFARRKN